MCDSGCSSISFQSGLIADLGTGAVRAGIMHAAKSHTAGGRNPVKEISVTDSILADGGWVFPAGTAVFVESVRLL